MQCILLSVLYIGPNAAALVTESPPERWITVRLLQRWLFKLLQRVFQREVTHTRRSQAEQSKLKAKTRKATERGREGCWRDLPGSCRRPVRSACCCALKTHGEVEKGGEGGEEEEKAEREWKLTVAAGREHHRRRLHPHRPQMPAITPVSPQSTGSDGPPAPAFMARFEGRSGLERLITCRWAPSLQLSDPEAARAPHTARRCKKCPSATGSVLSSLGAGSPNAPAARLKGNQHISAKLEKIPILFFGLYELFL